MSQLLSTRALAAAAALVAVTACSEGSALLPDTATAPQTARGSTPSAPAAASVTGTWAATLPGANAVDSTQWSLHLTQRDSKLEGSLIRISYFGSQSSVGVSAIKRGSISGQSVSLEFDRGEGAETPTLFNTTVSDDGRTMTGFHSRYTTEITLTRR